MKSNYLSTLTIRRSPNRLYSMGVITYSGESLEQIREKEIKRENEIKAIKEEEKRYGVDHYDDEIIESKISFCK